VAALVDLYGSEWAAERCAVESITVEQVDKAEDELLTIKTAFVLFHGEGQERYCYAPKKGLGYIARSFEQESAG
jgi:hypothetical protein